MKSKKGQFMIFSVFFLFLLLVFIYSLETVNTYKFENGDLLYIHDIEEKICPILNSRNGTILNDTIPTVENSINSYCNSYEVGCIFTIENITSIPPLGNWSYLNISQFEMNYVINNSHIIYNSTFRCDS